MIDIACGRAPLQRALGSAGRVAVATAARLGTPRSWPAAPPAGNDPSAAAHGGRAALFTLSSAGCPGFPDQGGEIPAHSRDRRARRTSSKFAARPGSWTRRRLSGRIEGIAAVRPRGLRFRLHTLQSRGLRHAKRSLSRLPLRRTTPHGRSSHPPVAPTRARSRRALPGARPSRGLPHTDVAGAVSGSPAGGLPPRVWRCGERFRPPALSLAGALKRR